MIEQFQTEVIRPIIKSKNDFIILFFENQLKIKKIDFSTEIEKRNKIETILKNDTYIRNILLGSIISNFENNGLVFYFENKQELSKRIINIIAKRLFDNLK